MLRFIPRGSAPWLLIAFMADMDIEKETNYWSDILNIPLFAFRKPYIKKSFFDKRKNYKGRFGHGTCNIMFNNRDMYEFIMMSIKYLGQISYATDGFTAPGKV